MCNLSDGIYYSGYDNGKDETTNQLIDNMLKDNLSNEAISKYSGKSVDYIETRRKALKSTMTV